MEMGEKIRKARLEAGLTQSQLCRGLITRNMLSQIEHGTARPSLSTLEELSRRLQKPAALFLGEEEPAGRCQVDEAWRAYREGRLLDAARSLDACKDQEDFEDLPVLRTLVLLELAKQALVEQRDLYARELLGWIREEKCGIPQLERWEILLRGQLKNQQAEPLCRELPSLDPELMLRAKAALEQKNPRRAGVLLEAAEERTSSQWGILRGRAFMQEGKYKEAADCFHLAEQTHPEEVFPYLEKCYRELEDFKQAYFYACRQK